MKVQYNAPLILTFTIACTAILIVDAVTGGNLMPYFAVGPSMDASSPVDWFRLVSHVLGHGGVAHLMSNAMLLLLLGPMLEEKYGTAKLALMFFVTALVIGALNVALFPSGLLGASGIVFMCILLSSVTNVQRGRVPLTFILVVVLYVGQEFWKALGDDQISQFAHIIGGVCGAAFGFFLPGGPRGKPPAPTTEM